MSLLSTRQCHVLDSRRYCDIYIFVMNKMHPQPDDPEADKLYKIRPLLQLLPEKFENLYVPEKIISIDESMIPFTGRIGFWQFIKNKRTRFRIKVWVVAESSTGYVFRLQVYTGRDRASCQTEVGQGTRVVNDLIQPYEHKEYRLYVDNFYTSSELFSLLYERNVYACCTLRKGRRNVPGEITIDNPGRHQRGYSQWLMSGPILAQSWLDTKPVYFLSTIHKPHYPPGTPEKNTVVKRRCGARGVDVSCPPLLHDYNTGMGGVHLNNRQRKFYSLCGRSYRWYRRVFFHMLEVTLHKFYILMKRVSSNFGLLEMIICLVTQLIGATHGDRHVGRPRSADVDLPRLDREGLHTPIYRQTRAVCKVCGKIASDNYPREYARVSEEDRPKKPRPSKSFVADQECEVALCLNKNRNCFRVLHTKVVYWQWWWNRADNF